MRCLNWILGSHRQCFFNWRSWRRNYYIWCLGYNWQSDSYLWLRLFLSTKRLQVRAFQELMDRRDKEFHFDEVCSKIFIILIVQEFRQLWHFFICSFNIQFHEFVVEIVCFNNWDCSLILICILDYLFKHSMND